MTDTKLLEALREAEIEIGRLRRERTEVAAELTELYTALRDTLLAIQGAEIIAFPTRGIRQ